MPFTMPLVSVIIPTYNSASHIQEALVSVTLQDLRDLEIIVSDDDSADSTLGVVKNLAEQDSRVRILEATNNAGAAVARNSALEIASGRYVAFLDSDDIWIGPDKLSKQIEFMKQKSAAISFTAYQVAYPDERAKTIVDLRCPDVVTYKDMLAKRATMGCSTVILDTCAVGKVQMPLVRTGQDYGLWLSILRQGHAAYRLPEVLTEYRILPNSISRNKFKKALRQWQIYRELEGLGRLESSFYFANYAYRAVFRS